MLSSRKHCWTALLGLILMVSLAEGQRLRHGKRSDISCGPNYYKARTSSGNLECVRCPTGCDPGTTIVTQCGFGIPQTCRPCEPTPGKTCASGIERSCVLCDIYGRTVEEECNIYNQTICGGCREGFYENLDDPKIGNTRYCRKCTPADTSRYQCQLQTTVTPSVTLAKPTTSEQMAIKYDTVETSIHNVKPSTSSGLIMRQRQSTKATKKAEDNSAGWGAIGAGFVTTLLIVLLFAYFVYRYRSFDEQKKTADIEMATLPKGVDMTEDDVVNKSSLFQCNPVCADMSPNDGDLPPGSCGHGVVHVPSVTEYDRLFKEGKEVGKDMPIEERLTLDMQQAIASVVNQRPAIPGDPDYKNVFIDLGIDTAQVLAANATGIADPSEALFRVLLAESSVREIKMADIITTLNKYKFYDLVKDICREITVQNN
ncbi:uncharacterized protein LOC144876182 [Branchiostoma floridae x Branchiostoma japonicum]